MASRRVNLTSFTRSKAEWLIKHHKDLDAHDSERWLMAQGEVMAGGYAAVLLHHHLFEPSFIYQTRSPLYDDELSMVVLLHQL